MHTGITLRPLDENLLQDLLDAAVADTRPLRTSTRYTVARDG